MVPVRRRGGPVRLPIEVGPPGRGVVAVHVAPVVAEEVDRGHAVVGRRRRPTRHGRDRPGGLVMFDVLLGSVVPVPQRRRDSLVEDGGLHGGTHLRHQSIQRESNVAAENLNQNPHANPDHHVFSMFMETRLQPELKLQIQKSR